MPVPSIQFGMPCMAIPASHTPSRSRIERQRRSKTADWTRVVAQPQRPCLAFKCRYCGRYRALSHLLRRIWTMSPGIHVSMNETKRLSRPIRCGAMRFDYRAIACLSAGLDGICVCVCTCMNTSLCQYGHGRPSRHDGQWPIQVGNPR